MRVSAKPDQTFTSFDLLLPEIRLAKPTAKQKFQAIGITTVHKTTIAGPGTGVEQGYKTVALRGTAQLVVTLAPKTAKARAN